MDRWLKEKLLKQNGRQPDKDFCTVKPYQHKKHKSTPTQQLENKQPFGIRFTFVELQSLLHDMDNGVLHVCFVSMGDCPSFRVRWVSNTPPLQFIALFT
jgi:hypothetical protein